MRGFGKGQTYEETQAENGNQAEFLAFTKVETGEDGKRQDKDNGIGDNIARGVVVPER